MKVDTRSRCKTNNVSIIHFSQITWIFFNTVIPDAAVETSELPPERDFMLVPRNKEKEKNE